MRCSFTPKPGPTQLYRRKAKSREGGKKNLPFLAAAAEDRNEILITSTSLARESRAWLRQVVRKHNGPMAFVYRSSVISSRFFPSFFFFSFLPFLLSFGGKKIIRTLWEADARASLSYDGFIWNTAALIRTSSSRRLLFGYLDDGCLWSWISMSRAREFEVVAGRRNLQKIKYGFCEGRESLRKVR